ncbi:MAG: hypothetical protein ACXAEX_04635 [Promethearchaeota archaeon]
MEKNEEWDFCKSAEWDFCKPEDDRRGFLVAMGVFLTLWGVHALWGDIYWWAAESFLWGVFLVGVGSSIVVNTVRKWLRR